MMQEKVSFFSSLGFETLQTDIGMAKKTVKQRVFDAKNYEESIGHNFRALSRAILAEIANLCNLPSKLHSKRGPFTTLWDPLTP